MKTLRYEGAFEVEKSPEKIFKFLTNPQKFAETLPGYKSIEVSGEKFKVKLELTIWPLVGEATVEASFTLIEEPSYAKVTGKGSAALGTLDFTLEFKITKLNSKSKISWVFQGIVTGPAALVGEKLLNTIARNIIDEVTNNTIKALESINRYTLKR